MNEPDYKTLTDRELDLLAYYGKTPAIEAGARAEQERRWEKAEDEQVRQEFADLDI